jgi:hypothetical protein
VSKSAEDGNSLKSMQKMLTPSKSIFEGVERLKKGLN